MTKVLPVDDDDLARCVNCGLCLPHCPTYRVTGDEARSPRGRIAIIRNVQESDGLYDADTADALNSCIQCRGCEPACPSGVPYGRIIAGARQALVEQRLATPRSWSFPVLTTALGVLARPRLLAAIGRLVSLAHRLRLVPRRFRLGPLPLRLGHRVRRGSASPDVWILTGCVMDVWMRGTHRHTAALVTATDRTFGTAPGLCCGALHQHAGATETSRRMARRLMAAMPGEGPVLVNSAGCGAAMKEYGELLGTDDAHRFARRVRDVHEWLEGYMSEIMMAHPRPGDASRPTVVLQDPCHLRHVQKVHGSVRSVLEQVADVVHVDDDGLCCGAGGAYSILQPATASLVRDRKVAAIEAARAGRDAVVASANPGCSMFLSAAGLPVRHPIDIVAERLGLDR
ncbi:MAG: (Fe-S)-binding protein [Actinomycetota bacterium]